MGECRDTSKTATIPVWTRTRFEHIQALRQRGSVGRAVFRVRNGKSRSYGVIISIASTYLDVCAYLEQETYFNTFRQLLIRRRTSQSHLSRKPKVRMPSIDQALRRGDAGAALQSRQNKQLCSQAYQNRHNYINCTEVRVKSFVPTRDTLVLGYLHICPFAW